MWVSTPVIRKNAGKEIIMKNITTNTTVRNLNTMDILIAQACSVIDYRALVHFLAQEMDKLASAKDKTTIADEIGIIGKRTLKAAAYDAVRRDSYADNLHRKLAFSNAELTEAERISMVNGLYKTAAKKIIWLNTISRVRTGQSFLKILVNTNDIKDCRKLATVFSFVMSNQDLF
jgi:hypothetical protein